MSVLSIVEAPTKPKAKRQSASERIYELKYINEELTRQLKREQERADLLSVQLEELIDDREENYIQVDNDRVAIGEQVVVEAVDAERVKLLLELEVAQMRFDMGILSEADTIRNLMWKLV